MVCVYCKATYTAPDDWAVEFGENAAGVPWGLCICLHCAPAPPTPLSEEDIASMEGATCVY